MMSPGASSARRGTRVATPAPGSGARRLSRRTGHEDWAGSELRLKVGFQGGGSFRKDALRLEGGVSAWWTRAPHSAPLSPPRELHAAPPPATPTQTVVRPAGFPRRKRLMVRSAPPTQRPPTSSGCVSGLRRMGLGLRPQTLLRVGGVVLSSSPALRPRRGPGLRPRTSPLEAGLSPPLDLGRGLNLCSQTPKRASQRLGLTSAPHVTPHLSTPTQGCRTDTQTLNEGQRSLNKVPGTINTVQGQGARERPDLWFQPRDSKDLQGGWRRDLGSTGAPGR
uniref:putative uncharacterized protein C19orf73 homolog n=1 Tax=Callithrix jacchus TaxID=9483 RepID=UPI0023DD6562|nr:putative uncharacterized protein C19orf73 homolog [Callithrix jacchus]